MEQEITPKDNTSKERSGAPKDIGSLLTSIAWEETPRLGEFPTRLAIPTIVGKSLQELLQLSLVYAAPIEDVLPQLRHVDPAVVKEAEEFLPKLTQEEFAKRFEGRLRFVSKSWHPPIDVSDLFLALSAKLKNKPVKREYDLSFITSNTGELKVLGPNQGNLSHIWGVRGQRYSALYDGYEATHDVSKFRTVLDVHTHPSPQCPTVPNDLYELITDADMLEGKPIPATGTVDEENFWIVIRSRRSPNFHREKLDMVLKYWDKLHEKDPTERLMMFARKYHLAVYRGDSKDFGVAQFVRT